MMNKVETVAMLLNGGGISESDLLKLPNVRRKDILEAKNLLQRADAPPKTQVKSENHQINHKV